MELYRIWIYSDLDVSPLWCQHFQYLGFLTGAPTMNFGISRSRYWGLTLFRATKSSVVICRACLLYETSYLFCSTLFEPTDFQNYFRHIWKHHPDRAAAFSTCLVNDMDQTYKLWALLIWTNHDVKPLLTRTILMSNDSSSSSHLLSAKGETVWKRETWRENRNTRKEDRYPVLGGRESRPLEERQFENKGCLWRTSSTLRRLTLSQSRGESTHLVLRAQLQKLISSALRLISI